MANENSFTYEIIQHVCVLGDRNNGWRRELNVVSWNGGSPKLDIRDWSYDRSGMGKGVTLTKAEVLKLQKNVRYVKLSVFEDIKPSGKAAPTNTPNIPVSTGPENATEKPAENLNSQDINATDQTNEQIMENCEQREEEFDEENATTIDESIEEDTKEKEVSGM